MLEVQKHGTRRYDAKFTLAKRISGSRISSMRCYTPSIYLFENSNRIVQTVSQSIKHHSGIEVIAIRYENEQPVHFGIPPGGTVTEWLLAAYMLASFTALPVHLGSNLMASNPNGASVYIHSHLLKSYKRTTAVQKLLVLSVAQ